MRQVFSKLEFRALSSTIAAIILLGSLSIGAGLVIVAGPTHPELTVNICQPFQVSCAATITLLARPATAATFNFILCDSGSIIVRVLRQTGADPATPDTPPPKQLV
jgi:hypothetical protein